MIASHSPTPEPLPSSSFVREHRRYDRMLEGFERRLLDTCVPERGLQVLDVGCGAGTTTLAAAQRVAPAGLVLGVDIDADAIAFASRRARQALLPQAQFRCADAADLLFEPASFDRVISRFGVLHFQEPVAAFDNLRSSLRPEGQLGFVCARGPELNPWATRPLTVVRSIIGAVPEPSVGKGPFTFADEDHVRGILERAGFVDVSFEAIDEPVVLGADVDDVIEFFFETDLRKLGPALDASRALAIADGLREVLRDWVDGAVVRSPASAWLVTARPASA